MSAQGRFEVKPASKFRIQHLLHLPSGVRVLRSKKSGDALFFHYSGHGGREPSASGADGYVETLCPEAGRSNGCRSAVSELVGVVHSAW